MKDAPKGATWLCTHCRATSDAPLTCHAGFFRLVEKYTMERDEMGVPVDVTIWVPEWHHGGLTA